MLNFIKVLTLTAAIFSFMPPGHSNSAVEEKSMMGPEDLRLIFEDFALSAAQLPPEDIIISNFSSRPQKLYIPAGIVD